MYIVFVEVFLRGLPAPPRGGNPYFYAYRRPHGSRLQQLTKHARCYMSLTTLNRLAPSTQSADGPSSSAICRTLNLLSDDGSTCVFAMRDMRREESTVWQVLLLLCCVPPLVHSRDHHASRQGFDTGHSRQMALTLSQAGLLPPGHTYKRPQTPTTRTPHDTRHHRNNSCRCNSSASRWTTNHTTATSDTSVCCNSTRSCHLLHHTCPHSAAPATLPTHPGTARALSQHACKLS